MTLLGRGMGHSAHAFMRFYRWKDMICGQVCQEKRE